MCARERINWNIVFCGIVVFMLMNSIIAYELIDDYFAMKYGYIKDAKTHDWVPYDGRPDSTSYKKGEFYEGPTWATRDGRRNMPKVRAQTTNIELLLAGKRLGRAGAGLTPLSSTLHRTSASMAGRALTTGKRVEKAVYQ